MTTVYRPSDGNWMIHPNYSASVRFMDYAGDAIDNKLCYLSHEPPLEVSRLMEVVLSPYCVARNLIHTGVQVMGANPPTRALSLSTFACVRDGCHTCVIFISHRIPKGTENRTFPCGWGAPAV